MRKAEQESRVTRGPKGTHERGFRNPDCRSMPDGIGPNFQGVIDEILAQTSGH
jgi:hypothetical protein